MQDAEVSFDVAPEGLLRAVEPVRKADGRNESEPVRKADGRNESEPVRKADGRNESEPVRKADGRNESEPVRKADGRNESEPVRKADGRNESEPVRKADGRNESEPVRKADGRNESEPVRKADGRNESEPARKADGRNESDWRAQLRNSIRNARDLAQALRLSPEERAGAERAEREGLPIGITPYYLSLCHPEDPACPIRLQCVPLALEAREVPGDMVDPLGEVEHEVAPHLICRYPDRVLLVVTDRCAVYCRFCTRSRIVGDGGGPAPLERLEPAFAWIKAHPEIRDVIVSGGDPLAMATDRIDRLLGRIRAIESVETIRIATRVPVTLPMRITDELVRALRKHHPVWVMTHFNHPKELTPEALDACTRLVDAGFPLMNQTVLLAGVNDDASVLEALFRGLVRARVRPYYLLQTDPVRGTGHLRTPLARGVAIMEQLQGRLSGIALPKLICDTPGGRGKVPLLPDYVVSRAPGRTVLRTFRGEEVAYVDPPPQNATRGQLPL